MEVCAVDEEEVGRGVYGPQVAIYVERMELGWPSDSLGRDGLNDIALRDMVFERVHMCLVALLPNVGCVFRTECDGRLRWHGQVFALQQLEHTSNGPLASSVGLRDRSIPSSLLRHAEVCDYHHLLKEMIDHCRVCHKRFGASAVRVQPSGEVVHYGCVGGRAEKGVRGFGAVAGGGRGW